MQQNVLQVVQQHIKQYIKKELNMIYGRRVQHINSPLRYNEIESRINGGIVS